MKRSVLIITALLLLAVLCLTVCLRPGREPVPLGFLDGLDYTVRPKQMIRVLGEPYRIQDDRGRFETVSYEYHLVLNGVPAETRFTFSDNRTLYMATVSADAKDAGDAGELYAAWRDKITSACARTEGYFCNETAERENQCQKTETGFIRGAVGLHVELSVAGTEVRVQACYMD